MPAEKKKAFSLMAKSVSHRYFHFATIRKSTTFPSVPEGSKEVETETYHVRTVNSVLEDLAVAFFSSLRPSESSNRLVVGDR